MLGAGWIPGSTGNDFGDLLTGRPAQVNSGTALDPGQFIAWNLDGYIQDSWKIKKNLTLEYGVRIAKWTNNAEQNNLGAVFFPERYQRGAGTFLDAAKTRVNGVAYAADGDVPQGLIDNRPLFLMPRLNFAWDISGTAATLVLRGGAGLFYNRPMGNAEYDVLRIPPNGYVTSIDANAGASLGPVGLTYNTVPLVDPLNRIGRIGVTSINPDSIDYPRLVTTSLSLARRIPGQQVLEVSYVGTFGRHLLNTRQYNTIQPGQLSQGTLGNADLSNPLHRQAVGSNSDLMIRQTPYPDLGAIGFWEYTATSNYHSLQATLSRQTGRRFQYFLAYTFSKVLGTSVANGGIRRHRPLRRAQPHVRDARLRPHAHPERVLQLCVPRLDQQRRRARRPAQRLAVLGDLDVRQRHADLDRVQRRHRRGRRAAWYGTPRHPLPDPDDGAPAAWSRRRSAATRRRTARGSGEKVFNVGCIGIPTFPNSGPFVPPDYLRDPTRHEPRHHAVQELRPGRRQQEAAVPRGRVQHVQPGRPRASTAARTWT